MTPAERAEFIEELTAAIHTRVSDRALTPDEMQWVRNAIKMQEQSYKLRQAVIEKTMGGLVWAAIVALGYMLLGWATQHGYKP
jgi:hypothetical protein